MIKKIIAVAAFALSGIAHASCVIAGPGLHDTQYVDMSKIVAVEQVHRQIHLTFMGGNIIFYYSSADATKTALLQILGVFRQCAK